MSWPLRVTPIAAPSPPRAAHRCPTPRAHQRAIPPMRRRHVSWPHRVTPIAAPSPAAASSHPADAETSCVVAASRDAHRCPIRRARHVPSCRRGDAVYGGPSACRPSLPHPPAPATSHPTDAETPCVVAAPRDTHRCPIPFACRPSLPHPPRPPRPIPPMRRRRVSWPLRVTPISAPSPARTNVPSRRRPPRPWMLRKRQRRARASLLLRTPAATLFYMSH